METGRSVLPRPADSSFVCCSLPGVGVVERLMVAGEEACELDVDESLEELVASLISAKVREAVERGRGETMSELTQAI